MDDSRDRLVRRGDYVNGAFVRPEVIDGYINGVNPGDRSDILGRFCFSEAAVDDAVEHARLACTWWRRVSVNDRAAAVRRFRQALTRHGERVITLTARETGRPLWEVRMELGQALVALEHLLDEGVGLLAPRVLTQAVGRSDLLPRGVVAILFSYMSPLLYTSFLTAAALLSGNTVVFKPSKFTPGLGQLFAELWDGCKLPRGVLNMLQGSGSGVGRRLIAHPGISAALLVGSAETSQELRRALLDRPDIPIWALTGGKGVAIALNGCELDRAVYDVMVGAFLSAGQRHNSTGRLIVQAGIYDELVDALVRRTGNLNIGYAFDAGVFMGPLISENLRSRFRKYGRGLARDGNGALLEGSLHTPGERRGFYVTPSVHAVERLGNTPELDSEPPGPTLLIYKVDTLEEAAALHNQLPFRSVCSIYPAAGLDDLQELVDRLRTGAVHINQPTLSSTLPLPSVGLGRSSSGLPTNAELVRVLCYPRAWLVSERPFNPQQLWPGTNWDIAPSAPLVDVDELDEDTIIDEDLGSMLEPEL